MKLSPLPVVCFPKGFPGKILVLFCVFVFYYCAIDFNRNNGLTKLFGCDLEKYFIPVQVASYLESNALITTPIRHPRQCFKNQIGSAGPTGRTVNRPQNRSGSIKKPFLH